MIHALNPSLDYRNCVSVTSQIKIACFTTVIHALMNLLLETSLATFIAKSQSNFFKKQKDTLNQIDCILVLDFAENYSCYPGLWQGFYWNNSQATIHPFVLYYVDPEKETVCHKAFACISNHMTHDTVAVQSFYQENNLF